jgi:hypothetical protein
MLARWRDARILAFKSTSLPLANQRTVRNAGQLSGAGPTGSPIGINDSLSGLNQRCQPQ